MRGFHRHNAREMSAGLFRPFLVFAALLAAGLLLGLLEAPARGAARSGQPEFGRDALGREAAGMLGGFRAIAADLLWIRLYAAWEARDAGRVEALAYRITQVDPRPSFFWINAAHILAFDVPSWRVAGEGGPGRVPAVRVEAINREQARKALHFLQRGLDRQPDNPLLHLEVARIHLHRLDDRAVAAEWFGRASRLPDAPPYAARMQTEILRGLGRP